MGLRVADIEATRLTLSQWLHGMPTNYGGPPLLFWCPFPPIGPWLYPWPLPPPFFWFSHPPPPVQPPYANYQPQLFGGDNDGAHHDTHVTPDMPSQVFFLVAFFFFCFKNTRTANTILTSTFKQF